jgi:hypothetical protein
MTYTAATPPPPSRRRTDSRVEMAMVTGDGVAELSSEYVYAATP